MKNTETNPGNNQKKRFHSILSRLPFAICTVLFCTILIIWDMGIIDIPFLKRTQRREPVSSTETNEDTNLTETLESENVKPPLDPVLAAAERIRSLYDFSFLGMDSSLITTEDYQANTMSLVKVRLPQKEYTLISGILVSSDGAFYRAKDMTPVPSGSEYLLTEYEDALGNPLFMKKESEEYFFLDLDALLFRPSVFEGAALRENDKAPSPSISEANSNAKLILSQDGLYGYEGFYEDGRRTVDFAVGCQYPTAFSYSEGFAVMADAQGKVTVRNEKGEIVFYDVSIVLPDSEITDAFGFHYFNDGVLRVVFATYDEKGNVTETREGAINTLGQEIAIPKGYRIHSYLDSVFILTDGEKFGYYHKKGAWITSPVYAEATLFSEGLAKVKSDNGKWGLIDARGKEILPCAFDSIGFSQNGIFMVTEENLGSFILYRVRGNYMPEESAPPSTSQTSKITITRGPENTFSGNEESEILELPEVVTTTTRVPIPGFWE